MTVTELITIVIAASSLVTAVSILWAKIIHPIKAEIKQIDENAKEIKRIEKELIGIFAERAEEIDYDTQVRSILIESLIAVLDGLEQVGANHAVTEQKRKLINFLTKQVNVR